MSKSLLLLGGTGIFGEAFINAHIGGLLKKWKISKIINASRNPNTIKQKFNKKKLYGLDFIKLDLFKNPRIPVCDYIIYMATSTKLNVEDRKLKDHKKRNLSSLKNFFRIIKDKKFDNSKILYTSSGIIYGKNKKKIKISENKVNKIKKDEFTLNQKIYFDIKKKSEKFIINQKKKNKKIQISIARCFAFVGPEIPLESYFIVGNLLKSALLKREFSINKQKSLNTYRTFMHTKDLVTCLMSILSETNKKLKIINVGSKEVISIYNLVKKFSKKYKFKIIYKQDDKKHQIDFYVPSTKKLERILNFKKFTNLNSSINQTFKKLSEKKL